MIAKYGNSYAGQDGWAAKALGIKKPTFRVIEENVMAHMRPYYKMASYNVHAGPKGIYFRLGVYQQGPDYLLTGPSEIGLEEAGTKTAFSICQAATTLLSLKTNMDCLVICDILERFLKDTEDAFLQAQQFLSERLSKERADDE